MVLLGIVFGILMSGFFSGMETGIYSVNRMRVRLYSANSKLHSKQAQRVSELLKDTESLICMALLGTNIGVHLTTAITTEYFGAIGFYKPEVIATLILTPFIFIFAETVPKNIFRNRADSLIYRLSYLIRILKTASMVLVYPLNLLIRLIIFTAGAKKSEDDYLKLYQINQLLLTAEQEGILTPYQKKIAENMIELSEVEVMQAMIPLARASFLLPDFTREDVIEKTRATGYSRFPIYDEKERKVRGIVNFFDIYTKDAGFPIMRKAPHVKFYTPIREALLICSKKQPMIIVSDDKNLPIGIVTINDLLERVVGNLAAK